MIADDYNVKFSDCTAGINTTLCYFNIQGAWKFDVGLNGHHLRLNGLNVVC